MNQVVQLTHAGCQDLFEQGITATEPPGRRFLGPDQSAPANDDSQPWVVSSTTALSSGQWLVHVLPSTRWFAGHFPERPLLPGIVQIHWCIALAEQLGYVRDDHRGLQRVKFIHPILPDAIVRIELQPQGAGHGRNLNFKVHSRLGLHSKGSFEYG